LAETVASLALRGLGNALNLIGERDSPPGIELGLPSQPVHDLTPYIRYGSAPVFGHFEDGWTTFSHSQTLALAVFSADFISDWSAVVTGDVGLSQNRLDKMALWIYGISLRATPATALADIGASSALLTVPVGIASGTYNEHQIFLNGGNITAQQGALLALMGNENAGAFKFPIQWAAGAQLRLTVQNVNANSIVWEWIFLCRLVPRGVPPLP